MLALVLSVYCKPSTCYPFNALIDYVLHSRLFYVTISLRHQRARHSHKPRMKGVCSVCREVTAVQDENATEEPHDGHYSYLPVCQYFSPLLLLKENRGRQT